MDIFIGGLLLIYIVVLISAVYFFPRYTFAMQRAIDLKIFWPECVRKSENLDQAKAAFAKHAFKDPAWTNHYTKEELRSFIDELKAPLEI